MNEQVAVGGGTTEGSNEVVARRGATSLRLNDLVANRGLRFVVVGGVNSAFAYGVFAALQLTLGRVVHYLVVLVLSNIVSILEAFILQRAVVWRVRGHWWRQIIRFSTVYLVVLALNVPLLSLLVEVIHLPVLLAQGLIMAANAIGTFSIHRVFTFRTTG